MSTACGCDADFAGQAACHCSRCHRSFADRPLYDAHRLLMRPCIHPVVLSQVLIDHRGWGWLARQEVAEISGPVVSFLSVSHHRTGLIA